MAVAYTLVGFQPMQHASSVHKIHLGEVFFNSLATKPAAQAPTVTTDSKYGSVTSFFKPFLLVTLETSLIYN